ncbi:MAG: Ig-like domain-containing protein [Spirochaetes bacterium]|nr:Ig-like domain-containing protein [Spirochaetota bacterium]
MSEAIHGGNISPAVSVTSPADGAHFAENSNITITADANDSDGSISQVEFFQGSVFLGVDYSAPYSVIWNNVSEGTYTISAVATDNEGATGTSGIITIYVGESNPGIPAWDSSETYLKDDVVTHNGRKWRARWWTQGEEPGTTGEWGVWEDLGPIGTPSNNPPSISIVSPANDSSFAENSNITIEANAGDSDGTISSVEFFQNGNSLGSTTSAPYSMTWTNVGAGSYTLTAVATDDDGASTTSGSISITVGSSGTDTWAPGVYYELGDQVVYGGRTWTCVYAHTSNASWYPGAPGLWFWE